MRKSRSARSVAVALATVFATSASLAVASPAGAYEIDDFSANILKADGTTFESQAGAVPHLGIISYDTVVNAQASPAVPPIVEQAGSTRNIQVTVPEGLVPNPESIPECSDDQLHDRTCPTASQVGMVELRLRSYLPATATTLLSIPVGTKGWLGVKIPLYNMERSNDSQLARFAFDSSQAPNATTGHVTEIIGAMRPDDHRLYFTISDIVTPTTGNPTQPLLAGATMRFWGKPNAAAHDGERGFAQLRLISTDAPGTFPGPPAMPSPPFPPMGTPIPANAPVDIPLGQTNPTGAAGITNPNATFLRSPTSCSGPQKAELELTSWQGETRNADDTIGEETDGLQGCDQVPFSSSTAFGPSPMQSDAPVPLGVTLDVPQAGDDDPLATAHVKRVSVLLPPGMSISPSAANGLDACSDARFAQGTNDPITCPAASRIGNVIIHTPVLPDPLKGAVYVGQPLPGNRYRLFVNADGFGISIRLKGTVTPNPVTGQVAAVFDDNPQLPFSRFQIGFDGGSRAIVASPQVCGTAYGNSIISPWSGNAPDVSFADITVSGCAFPFAPGFEVRPSTLLSGGSPNLLVDFTRNDGHQYLMGVAATLPPGMVATLKGVQRCAEAQVAAQSCPGGSQIGIVSVKAGPGASPYPLSGPVYLTGAYRDGAFGAVVMIRAVAGPYDLGTVVVRQTIKIDPDTARVTVHSDPLPQIIEGIPLRLRELRINVSRKGFMRNPTSCGGQQVDAQLSSPQGGVASPSAALSFDDCAKLKFGPKLSLRLGHASQMRKFKYPALRARVTQSVGEAGIRSSQVILPKHVALAAKNAKGLCEVAEARADKCPEDSIVGNAVAETPLLDKELKGPVFFVKGERTDPKTGRVIATLPTLYVRLRGETTIHLRARTDVSRDRLVTTFPAVPDAPITRFTLTIKGGKNGIIQTTRDLCKAKPFRGTVRFQGHNGARPKTGKPRISTACSGSSSTKK